MLPIPTNATWQRSPTRATWVSHIEVSLDGPIVGHVEVAPMVVIIPSLRHLDRVAQNKKPVSVKILTLTGLYRCQSTKDADETKESFHN